MVFLTYWVFCLFGLLFFLILPYADFHFLSDVVHIYSSCGFVFSAPLQMFLTFTSHPYTSTCLSDADMAVMLIVFPVTWPWGICMQSCELFYLTKLLSLALICTKPFWVNWKSNIFVFIWGAESVTLWKTLLYIWCDYKYAQRYSNRIMWLGRKHIGHFRYKLYSVIY